MPVTRNGKNYGADDTNTDSVAVSMSNTEDISNDNKDNLQSNHSDIPDNNNPKKELSKNNQKDSNDNINNNNNTKEKNPNSNSTKNRRRKTRGGNSGKNNHSKPNNIKERSIQIPFYHVNGVGACKYSAKCPMCWGEGKEVRFSNIQEWRDHHDTQHHDETARGYPCPDPNCDRNSKNWYNYTNHVQTHDSVPPAWNCWLDDCELPFANIYSLLNHWKKFHTQYVIRSVESNIYIFYLYKQTYINIQPVPFLRCYILYTI